MTKRFLMIITLFFGCYAFADGGQVPSSNSNVVNINVPSIGGACEAVSPKGLLSGDGNFKLELDKKFDGTDLVQIILGIVTLVSVFGAAYISYQAKNQKDRELKSDFVKNRIEWMQEIRSAYSEFAAAIITLMANEDRESAGAGINIEAIDLQDVMAKVINFNVLLNPVDNVHGVIVKIMNRAMEGMGKKDHDAVQINLDRMSTMIQFVIRLEWLAAKLDISDIKIKQHDVERMKLFDSWVRSNSDFKEVCDEFDLKGVD